MPQPDVVGHKIGLLKMMALPAAIAVLALLWAAGLKDYLSLEYIQASSNDFKLFIADHFVAGALIYIACYIAATISCLPVMALLTLVAGFLFGLAWGVAFVLVGATAGATLLFLIARSSFGGILREKAGAFYDKVAGQIERGSISYMLFMRLIPGLPFSIANIIPALFGVPLPVFVITTTVGLLPVTLILVNLGQALGRISNMGDLFSPQVMMALSLLAGCALLPVIFQKIRRRAKNTAGT